MVSRDEAIRKIVGLCNRIPGSTTWNAAEWMYDELSLSLPVSNTGEWQPIETAPKDVDVLLAWESSDGKWEMEVGWSGHANKHKGGYSDGWLHGDATHWQPLPEAPK